tara:strand:+ start:158 stop:481 length:324 start_codon:yes stop_codon:yes gene_type:complete
LVFNNNFEPFGLVSDLLSERNTFDSQVDGSSGGGGAGGGGGGGNNNAIDTPNTNGLHINTKYTINLPRMCRSTECKDRLSRWGQESDGEFQIITTTFKKIINKLIIE